MYPICFKIGPLTIAWYGVLMATAFLLGVGIWTLLGRKEGRDFNFCSNLLFWIVVGSIVGARLAYVATDLRTFLDAPWRIVRLDQGGVVYYGGVAGGATALLLFARRYRERVSSLVDFVAVPLPLGHALGRIGCFLQGCCFGLPHEGLLSLRYPRGSAPWWYQVDEGRIGRDAPHSLTVYPVQFYEAAFNLVLFLVVLVAYRRRKRDGAVAALYLTVYPVGRFLLEFLRGDEPLRPLGLTGAQYISVVLFGVGLALWVWSRRASREVPGH